MNVLKRTGETVTFDSTKIKNAIEKALISTKESTNPQVDSTSIANDIYKRLVDLKPETPFDIETIQNVVEETLMRVGHYATAKAYILFRNERAKLRQQVKQQRLSKPDQDSSLTLIDTGSKYFKGDIMGEFVYLRTYARWNQAQGRREMWPETVQRYIDFMRENLQDKLTTAEYDELQQAILNQEIMPSMRLLQFSGPAARRCNVCVYNCSFTAPESFKDLADIIYLSMSGTGVGFSVEAVHVEKFPIVKAQSGVVHDFTVDDSKEGWADAFLFGITSWYNGIDVKFDYSKLRPLGARLKTMGGRSSGPQPLMELLNFTREIVIGKAGHKLSCLNMHDIICKIGQIVVAGGTRRSALLSLSDLKDTEIRDCKNGAIWVTNPQRYLSNNSAVYNEKPDAITFMKEWLALAESGSGERGIFNRGGVAKLLPQRRQEVLKDDVKHVGLNPCVTGDTIVATVKGPVTVDSLVGLKIDVIVNGKAYPMESDGFFFSGIKKVYELKTVSGHHLKLTGDHKVCHSVLNGSLKSSKGIWIEQWTELKQLQIGDLVCLSNHHQESPEMFRSGVESVTYIGEERVYDVTVAEVHEFSANGIRVRNCGEVVLKPSQFCNLSEVVCRPDDTVESLHSKLRLATILGTYQSTLTKYGYLSDRWKANQEQERLLGVSLTGVMDCPVLRDNEELLSDLRRTAIGVNVGHAARFGINPSTAITAVKPSGSVSQMVNSASGLHTRYAPYYIRRIRISATDPLFQLMKDQGYKYSPETGQSLEKCNTFVLEFAVKAPDNAICTKDLTALQQLEVWKKVKINYTEHNPSVTISVKPDEWIPVQNWVYANWDYVTGLSFLPYAEHIYALAPYEEITKEQYHKLLTEVKPVDFSKLAYYEQVDNTDVKKELACVGGVCEL